MYVNDVGWLTMFKKGILAKKKKYEMLLTIIKHLKIDLTSFWNDKANSISPKSKIVEQRLS